MGRKMNTVDELLSIREASDYFQVGAYTFYRLAKAGKIPAKKVDNAWRFAKKDLCTWIACSPYDRRIRENRRHGDVSMLSHDGRCGKDRRLKAMKSGRANYVTSNE